LVALMAASCKTPTALAVTLLAFFAATCNAQQVTNLPGWNATDFGIYAGYVDVGPSSSRHLFYVLTESQHSPDTAPLVVWLNGGPGCSSIGGGLMSELGPWFPNKDGSELTPNAYAWNTVANVLFVESPAGVGFSYADNKADYTVGDDRTWSDLYDFVQGFIKQYPKYQGRALWIAGESYGGHYVPGFAYTILNENAKGTQPQLNLKGFLVGNAWTDAKLDNLGTAYDWWSHSLISESTFRGMVAACNFSTIGPLLDAASADTVMGSAAVAATARRLLQSAPATGGSCDDYVTAADREMGNIFIYDIYADVCTSGASTVAQHAAKLLGALGRPAPRHPLGAGPDTPAGGSEGYNPCIDDAVTKYMNRKDVQEAIHARTDLGYPWATCSPFLNYSRADLLSSMLPIYESMVYEHKIDIMVYSGDVDGIVATPGTKMWLSALANSTGMVTHDAWRPYTVDGQVGGYTTSLGFSGASEPALHFATVRNAGHMVPYTQKSRALHLFSNFISGKPL